MLPIVRICGPVGAQVVVGTRRSDDDGDLMQLFGADCAVVDLDHERFFEVEDLVAYARGDTAAGRRRAGRQPVCLVPGRRRGGGPDRRAGRPQLPGGRADRPPARPLRHGRGPARRPGPLLRCGHGPRDLRQRAARRRRRQGEVGAHRAGLCPGAGPLDRVVAGVPRRVGPHGRQRRPAPTSRARRPPTSSSSPPASSRAAGSGCSTRRSTTRWCASAGSGPAPPPTSARSPTG